MTPEPAWVDLGLPSGILWRDTNLGGVGPQSVGMYFSWGNTEGHLAGAGYDFSQEVYDESPAASIESNLTLENDAANVMLGDGARMPSESEFEELIANCTTSWVTLNNVSGLLLTSRANGRTLFLPAAGRYNGTSLESRDVTGYYWSTLYGTPLYAYRLLFEESRINTSDSNSRRFGFPIRPVKSA